VKKHTKIYYDYFNYYGEFVSCEICGAEAVDIHHIESRGMGGSIEKDDIKNLIAVCRACHIEYGDKKDKIEFLKSIHLKNI